MRKILFILHFKTFSISLFSLSDLYPLPTYVLWDRLFYIFSLYLYPVSELQWIFKNHVQNNFYIFAKTLLAF